MRFENATMPRDFDLGNDDWKFDCDHVWMLVAESKDGEQFWKCSRCGIDPDTLEDQDEI